MINAKEAEIAQLKLLGNTPEKISEMLGIDIDWVNTVLEKREVIVWMEEVELQSMTRSVSLKKIQGAKNIIDKVIQGVEKIADEIDAEKWNKNHVELFKLFLTNLAQEEAKVVKFIQNNFINNAPPPKSETNILKGFEEKLERMDSRTQAKFWADLDSLINSYLSKSNAIEISSLQK